MIVRRCKLPCDRGVPFVARIRRRSGLPTRRERSGRQRPGLNVTARWAIARRFAPLALPRLAA